MGQTWDGILKLVQEKRSIYVATDESKFVQLNQNELKSLRWLVDFTLRKPQTELNEVTRFHRMFKWSDLGLVVPFGQIGSSKNFPEFAWSEVDSV